MYLLLSVANVAIGLATASPVAPVPYCQGDYAEDMSALSPAAREREAHTSPYSFAVRTTATYECVSYGADGNLKHARSTATAFGTAFGLRADGADTLLVTNQHVAEWPAVTDDDHPVDGIASGCKRVADTLQIVDDDHDTYAADDIALTRVVVDPALDIAVLRAHAKLQILPWKIGRSAGLSPRDAVEVKGFPLGEFRATNVGKVISAYAHDTQGAWEHDDFVVDALLTSGGSGSPVLAVSCKTGELELVGVFHARYSAASALNVVVSIDQLRDLLTTLKRSPRPADAAPELDAAARAHLAEAAHHDPDAPFFSVGTLFASVRARADGTLVWTLFGSDFPRTSAPLLAIEDLPGDDPKVFGKPGAIYLGGALGLQPYAIADADAETAAAFARVLGMLRKDALAAFDYRDAARVTASSRDASDRVTAQKRALARMLDAQREPALAIADVASRAAGKSAGPALSLAEVEAGAAPTAP
jgi:serine protease Do